MDKRAEEIIEFLSVPKVDPQALDAVTQIMRSAKSTEPTPKFVLATDEYDFLCVNGEFTRDMDAPTLLKFDSFAEADAFVMNGDINDICKGLPIGTVINVAKLE